ncbi:alpha-galactosidase [Gryllotalpicola protaetiae]|uniref:alpha-galactosidase n=1 Tax=Gryllotalpicola protaetiae TaxID=2419771 RepID=A0A387BPC3_9MICO|nr:alpha-galactosidase [Gryllotalpicola protaetiae]AYG02867.1 alpha-galactosidase [Gryllotalpicola protaetiae]
MVRYEPLAHLPRGGTSLVIAGDTDRGVPIVAYWGEDLGSPSELRDEVGSLVHALVPQPVSGGLDVPVLLSALPLESQGWLGTPGLVGSRGGRDFSPRFRVTDRRTEIDDERGATEVFELADDEAMLDLELRLVVDVAGLFRQSARLTNRGSAPYELQSLALTFPVPATATEVLDTTGRHLRERFPQRHTLTTGRYLRESRRGRPGADATLLLAVGEAGFGFERGLVHAVHLAWSGDHRLSVERTPTGETFLQAEELLRPGEVVLVPGESYETPVAIGAWGDGLNALSARFHESVRARPLHPSRPRPVTLNTWEAVYFDLGHARLLELARAGARLGIERFVLDDGWFRGRRDDHAGLGDWFVDEGVFPDGLGPLIDEVTALGLEFGLWVEPEMVNPDSELARAHPEWILQPGHGRLPLPGRRQQVLDLTQPGAFDHLLERLDAVLTENPKIAYLKWDHNRDLLEAGSTATGRPVAHAQTLAVYRLMDELRARHPALEIESCASGGARVDLGILARTDRVWTSDCIDPIERLTIQKYTGLLLPPELMGMHISGPRSHSTGRTASLALRAGVALFGHLGVEWDVTGLTEAEERELAGWIALHKERRDWLHTGRVVHAELADPGADLRGVVAADGSRALFALTQVTSASAYPSAPITFPGLDDDRVYAVELLPLPGASGGPRVGARGELAWVRRGAAMSGRMLRASGLRPPVLHPEELVLFELTAR